MKKIVCLGLMILLGSGILTAGNAPLHLYDIKSGKITYAVKGSGSMMGQTIEKSGTKRLVFDNYGAKYLTETNTVDKHSGMGGNQSSTTHTMALMDGESVYVVDFQQKQITKTANSGAAMLGGGNMKQKGLAMLKQMGGKKIGTDKVLGYTCDVWELMGIKQCIYKGITLKIESNVMGITNKEVATDIAFNIALSNKEFKLPNFPVQNRTGHTGVYQGGRAIPQPSADDMAKMAEMIKAMGAVMQKSGANSGQ